MYNDVKYGYAVEAKHLEEQNKKSKNYACMLRENRLIKTSTG